MRRRSEGQTVLDEGQRGQTWGCLSKIFDRKQSLHIIVGLRSNILLKQPQVWPLWPSSKTVCPPRPSRFNLEGTTAGVLYKVRPSALEIETRLAYSHSFYLSKVVWRAEWQVYKLWSDLLTICPRGSFGQHEPDKETDLRYNQSTYLSKEGLYTKMGLNWTRNRSMMVAWLRPDLLTLVSILAWL